MNITLVGQVQLPTSVWLDRTQPCFLGRIEKGEEVELCLGAVIGHAVSERMQLAPGVPKKVTITIQIEE